jgi:hypothetical protein
MVAQLRYKRGWQFWLETGVTGTLGGCPRPDVVGDVLAPAMIAMLSGEPVRLVICLQVEDSTRPGEMAWFPHRFDVPPDDSALPWHWWLLRCIQSVETHEMCEAFAIGDARPFYPGHGPGARLYEIVDHGLGGS